MKTLAVLTLLLFAMPTSNQVMIDFGADKAGTTWRVVNDGVMGGRSQGTATLRDDAIHFEGRVSLANNGGFASIRSPFGAADFDEAQDVTIRYKTNGYAVAFTMAVSDRFYVPNYRIPLDATYGEWTIVNVPLREVKQYRVGEPTGERLQPQAQARIQRIGFITDEKRAGPFELTVDYVRFE